MSELYYKKIFYDKNVIKLFERKNNNIKTLAKHVKQQNHFVIAKSRILQGLIG